MKKLFALSLVLSVLSAHATPKIEADLLLKGATVVDVAHGRLLRGKAVLVRGEKVLAVVDEKQLGRYHAAKMLDLRGRYVMPGLWDGHMHFGGGPGLEEENKRLLPLYLANGITSIRDCSGDMSEMVLQYRDDVAARRVLGPTIFTSAAKLEGYKPVWKGTQEVGTPEEVSRALDKLQAQHADFVKITENTMTREIYLEALRQAKARGMVTSAHLHAAVTLGQAAEAGLGSVEHMSYLLRGATPREAELTAAVAAGTMTARDASVASLASYDEVTARAFLKHMAQMGTAVTPTLNISLTTAYLDRDDHSRDPELRYIGPGLRATYDWRVQTAARATREQIAFRHANIEKAAAMLPLVQQSGMLIIAGTDAGYLNSFDYPGFGLHDEIELYVKYGLTPVQALQAAVLATPKFLGKQAQYGDLAAGKRADILVLDANPLHDVRATRQIRAVMTRGRYLDRAALDQMLKETADWVAGQKAPEVGKS